MANISYGVNILPKTNNTYTIGNSDYKWSNIYSTNLNTEDINTSGSFSHNRKANTTVGINSISIGDNCEASAEDSYAEGRYTTANGYYSHAEGNYTTASGMASHAEGTVTVANHASQHVFGEYNVADNSSTGATSRGNYVEIVGNGTASYDTSNARALDWSGNEYLKGTLYVGCNASSGSGTEVATKSDISGLSDQIANLFKIKTVSFANSAITANAVFSVTKAVNADTGYKPLCIAGTGLARVSGINFTGVSVSGTNVIVMGYNGTAATSFNGDVYVLCVKE